MCLKSTNAVIVNTYLTQYFSDIPVGQLHWMYLGLGKFILKKSFEISDNLKEKLVCIIDAMDQSSFKSKISSEIVTYIDSRQGKDIKNYVRLNL